MNKDVKNQGDEPQAMVLGDFDPRVVHERDPQTKRIKRVNAYTLRCVKGIRYYEWPKGSRNLWWENREPAGRLNVEGEPVVGAAHEKWEAPINEATELQGELEAKDFQNKQLIKELDSIKKELASNKFASNQKAQETASKVLKKESK